jgi:hypothetical protein
MHPMGNDMQCQYPDGGFVNRDCHTPPRPLKHQPRIQRSLWPWGRPQRFDHNKYMALSRKAVQYIWTVWVEYVQSEMTQNDFPFFLQLGKTDKHKRLNFGVLPF